jgi:glycosyltransferase involved in cell wall biosynthesis
MLTAGFGHANALYSFVNGDLPVVERARKEGLFVATEQVICPAVGKILADERNMFPGIETQDPMHQIEEGIARDLEQWTHSNCVLAPSEFVREESIKLGCDPNKIRLVPYGIPPEWIITEAKTIKRRVLFVGTVGLRKGSHYLAEACRILRKKGANISVQVIGPVSRETASSPLFEGPEYLGQIPRSLIKQKFQEADVFVLPTLAEGSGLAHLEALACGVPVITTPNCGSVVRDGIEGFIIAIRDPENLAERIFQIVSDRALRDQLSQAARLRASQFTWDTYKANLISAFS